MRLFALIVVVAVSLGASAGDVILRFGATGNMSLVYGGMFHTPYAEFGTRFAEAIVYFDKEMPNGKIVSSEYGASVCASWGDMAGLSVRGWMLFLFIGAGWDGGAFIEAGWSLMVIDMSLRIPVDPQRPIGWIISFAVPVALPRSR